MNTEPVEERIGGISYESGHFMNCHWKNHEIRKRSSCCITKCTWKRCPGHINFETFQGEKEGDNFKIAKVLEECCVPARNEWFERYKFFERISRVRRISWHVHTVTTLLWLSETYDFGDFREVFITGRFVHGLRGRRPVWWEKVLKGARAKR